MPAATWRPGRPYRDESSERLRLIHQLARYDGPLRDILPSERNKSLLSLDGAGRGELDYMTSDEHLLTLGGDPALRLLGYSPRGNAMIGLTEGGNRLIVWQIDSPHPEISWHTLFGKVWYENHDEPKYMWQSSGTDEPKFSLVPVIFGTLKATFYAMLFAVPLALLSAMYVSHFTTPGFRGVIKPTVEVMAAVPTVVIGFLILLWAAPLVGNWIVGVFVALLTVPLSFVLIHARLAGAQKVRLGEAGRTRTRIPRFGAGSRAGCGRGSLGHRTDRELLVRRRIQQLRRVVLCSYRPPLRSTQ